MGNILEGVTETVGEVISGVDTPLVPSAGVRYVLDAVGHRVLLAVLHSKLHADGSLEWKGEHRVQDKGGV